MGDSKKHRMLACPLCGGSEFVEMSDDGYGEKAIYCDDCPYCVRDNQMTIEELRDCHNTRPTLIRGGDR